MIGILKKIIRKSGFHPPLKEKPSAEAYDLWSEDYDMQPGNLMLDLDEQLFSGLLKHLDLKDKNIADIGCGTGRHWHKLLQQQPGRLTGFDVSSGMLNRLQEKFPEAYTCQITDNLFTTVADATYDVIVSTLTIAHIEDITAALTAWCRILKTQGDIIITDFHPEVLAQGGKRTFTHRKMPMAVQNFVHELSAIETILANHGWQVVNRQERIIDESVRHYYSAKHALPVYDRFKGARVIYGIHLRRE